MKLLSLTVASILASASAGAASVDSAANTADNLANADAAYVGAPSPYRLHGASRAGLLPTAPATDGKLLTNFSPALPFHWRNYSAPVVNAQLGAPPPVPKVMQFQHMVLGTDPSSPAQGAGITSVLSVRIIPVILTGADGTVYDPTAEWVPGQNGTAIELDLASPVFQMQPIGFAGGEVTQLLDAWVRNERWQYTQSLPNYHLLLNPSVGAPLRVKANATQLVDLSATLMPDGSTAASHYGRVISFDRAWLDSQFKSYMQARGIGPATIPIFVTAYNVAPQGMGGYHYNTGAQTWIWHTYWTLLGTPAGSPADARGLQHELAELIDDPYPTSTPSQPACAPYGPEQGPIGYEVGDPLDYGQSDFTIANPQGLLFYFQDLTYASWNEGQVPSQARGGRYTIRNAFRFQCF